MHGPFWWARRKPAPHRAAAVLPSPGCCVVPLPPQRAAQSPQAPRQAKNCLWARIWGCAQAIFGGPHFNPPPCRAAATLPSPGCWVVPLTPQQGRSSPQPPWLATIGLWAPIWGHAWAILPPPPLQHGPMMGCMWRHPTRPFVKSMAKVNCWCN